MSNISKLLKISRAASGEGEGGCILDSFEILQAGIISKYYVQLDRAIIFLQHKANI